MLRTTLLVVSCCAATVSAQHRSFFDAPVLAPGQLLDTEMVFDVDHDGDLDAVAFRNLANAAIAPDYAVLRNDAGTAWTMLPVATLSAGTGGLFAHADLDGDGWQDLVFSTTSSHALGYGIEIHWGQPGATFGMPTHIALGNTAVHLFRGRGNADAIDDLLVMHYDAAVQPTVRWLLGDPSRTLAAGISAAAVFTPEATVADVDGDSLDDVLVVGGSPSTFGVVRTTPAGFVLSASSPLPSGAFALQVVAIDLDGDGDDDAIVPASMGTTNVLLGFANLGAGQFVPGAPLTPTGLSSGTLYVGDWDHDGLQDLVNRSANTGLPGTFNHQLDVLRNTGGTFELRYGWRIGDSAATAVDGAGLYDVDGDGNLDLVDGRAIYFGTGTFADPHRGAVLELADWDDDGDLDQLHGTWRNDGRGTFASHPMPFPQQPPGSSFGAFAVADLDGDGLHDYLATRFVAMAPYAAPTFVAMRLLREQADGTIVDAGPAAAAGAQIDTGGVFTDADGDSDLDFVDAAGIWLNDGSGFFANTGAGFGGWVPIAAGDVDGDLDDDLLARFESGTGLALLYRTGPATYVASVLYAPSSTLSSDVPALLADLDDDGDLDVAGYRRDASNAVATLVFANVGGVFAQALTLPQVGTLSAGDVDGDGKTDLAIAAGAVDVLRRTGPGLSYEAPVRFALFPSYGDSYHLADIDQDGDADLCGPDTVTSRAFDGLAAGHRRQYGDGGPGTGQRRPILSLTGPIRSTLQPDIRLRSAVGGSVAFLLVGTGEANVPSPFLPGVTAYIAGLDLILGYGLGGTLGAAGAGGVDIAVPIPAGLGGTQLFLEFLVFDAGAPTAWSFSNGCELYVGG